MVISDLNYLEAVAQTSTIEGGQTNSSHIGQYAVANSGNNYGGGNLSLLNIAAAGNFAYVSQSNKKYFW